VQTRDGPAAVTGDKRCTMSLIARSHPDYAFFPISALFLKIIARNVIDMAAHIFLKMP
jgi:hypothetical protein